VESPTTRRLRIVLAGVTLLLLAGLIVLVTVEFLGRPLFLGDREDLGVRKPKIDGLID
jgi:hypothetical protein